VACEACVRGYGREFLASLTRIAHGVVSVRRIEQIDVATTGVVPLVDDVADLAKSRRRHGAARAADFEEIRLAELPRLRGMSHENGIQRTVLTSQALNDPEEERLGELAIAIGHAPRNVEEEKHDCMNGGLLATRQLSKTQIVIGKRRRRSGRAASL